MSLLAGRLRIPDRLARHVLSAGGDVGAHGIVGPEINDAGGGGFGGEPEQPAVRIEGVGPCGCDEPETDHLSSVDAPLSASPRVPYQSVRSRSTDFGQVGFEPGQGPTPLKPAFNLGFCVPYQNAQVSRSGEKWPPESDFRASECRGSQQVCPENPWKPATQRGVRSGGEHGSYGNWRRERCREQMVSGSRYSLCRVISIGYDFLLTDKLRPI